MSYGRTSLWAVLGLVAALACACGGPRRAVAGPWTKNAGEGYVKLSETAYFANGFVDASGVFNAGTDYLGWSTALYAEAGVAGGLHLQAYLPHIAARNRAAAASYLSLGPGDAIPGIQWSPSFLGFPNALRLDAKVPLYDVAGPGGAAGMNFPAAGDGQVDFTLSYSAGASLHPAPLFFFGEVGYRHRTEWYIGEGSGAVYGDGVTFFAQAGWTFFDRVTLAVNSGGIAPFQADTVTKGYLTLGPSLYCKIYAGFAVEASYDTTLWARNSADGQAAGGGFSYKF